MSEHHPPYAPPHGGVTITPALRERRHTLAFLDGIRRFSPVYLDTEVDMTGVRAHRAAHRADGMHLSTVTYVLHAAARVLADHPEANAAYRAGPRPRVARHASVNGKLTLDKTLAGRRVVLAAVLPDLHRAELADIQRQVEHYRDQDPATMPEFAGVRSLHRLPGAVAGLAFRATVGPLRTRARTLGTFAVTSLGHRPVDGFHSVGGTTVTLGVGRVLDRPVAVAGQVAVAPLMRLNLAFDHRVIDGAEAADVLAEIKARLEAYAPPAHTPPADAAHRAGHDPGDPHLAAAPPTRTAAVGAGPETEGPDR
ncbi:2-oxo acid dehydrogenase subunit E2 [Yinghuangia sp. ASG 101]|uniref:2-oxo acid dehydrogenase subunit E2 n=1 Tax=Yinghuangia sp. ASG 101 TaxID=2896848 RepID=UPI001E497E4C|nr:2-oxo acid dehydrogenase subunit E2 [Yinghuangia sp. ASG 101]UGQ12415.1 2-oxo acid dehydrogenase subunit E2 [Yinghuangia sp. ASG 101]